MSDSPRTDAAKRLVIDETPFPLGAIGMQAYEAVPAETCADIERELRQAEADLAKERDTALEDAAKVCAEKVDDAMPMPCPDGIDGCCVAHYTTVKRQRKARECATAIRAMKGKP